MEPEYLEMIASSPEEPLSSVTIGTRVKGPPSITVKVAAKSGHIAAVEASGIFDKLTDRYDQWYKHRNPAEEDTTEDKE